MQIIFTSQQPGRGHCQRIKDHTQLTRQELDRDPGLCFLQCVLPTARAVLGSEPRFSSAQVLSCARLFVTPWTAAHQASLSFTISQSLLKLMSIESVIPCNHFILCHPLLLLPSIFPSTGVFSNESAFCIRWPKN